MSKPQSKEQSNELFVRSIPYEATSDELSDFFSNFCPVKHSVIVTDSENNSRGFGFVSFTDPADAKKALEEARKTKFQGRFLQLDIAQRRARGSRDEDDNKEEQENEKPHKKNDAQKIEKRRPRLIIRNLPWSVKEPKQLEKIFAKFGNVTEVLIPRKPGGRMSGFAFVTMRKKAHAEKALEATKGLKIDGREVSVEFSIEKRKWIKKQNGEEDDDSEDEYDESDSEEEDDENEDEEEGEDDGEKPAKTVKKSKKKGKITPASNEQTIFVRNIPYDCDAESLEEHFEQFGPVLYALPVYDKNLDRPKGTAFVAFENVEDCNTCIANAPAVSSTSLLLPDDADPRYVFEGRVLHVTRALDKNRAEKAAEMSAKERAALLGKAPEEKDKRNLFLLNEGRITKDSKLATEIPASELEIREKSYDLRKQQLKKNPSLHLSMTRLAVRNIPRAMTETGLKALARKAVVEFAKEVAEKKRQPLSKEEVIRSVKYKDELGEAAKSKHGVVRQAKIIMEQKGSGAMGRSRGYGFIEYRDHKAALMGLRWLNAHEVTKEETLHGLSEEETKLKVQEHDDIKRRRLVVEFAIEHAAITKRRKENVMRARAIAQKRKAEEDEEGEAEEDKNTSKESKQEEDKNSKIQHIIGKKRKMRKLKKHG